MFASFQCLFKTFLGFVAIGIILPELKQDPKLGWEFLLKHNSTYGVIICFFKKQKSKPYFNWPLFYSLYKLDTYVIHDNLSWDV
jgi:hypothetical protein